MPASIFHPDFKSAPYWLEAWRPAADGVALAVPRQTNVAIVGAGYAGLSTAIELADHGVEATVVEANEPGIGASTRSGGGVSGGVNIGKSFSGKSIDPGSERAINMLHDAADAFSLIEQIIERENIYCFWERRGRFVGAWTPKHYQSLAKRVEALNSAAQSGSFMAPRERQREEIASDYYFGGMVVERSAKLHPALYYKGLLDAALRRSVTICADAPVRTIARNGTKWRLETVRGFIEADEVVIATNGYTGDVTPRLKRRVIPLASRITATEELPPDLAASLIPKGRTLVDTRRVLCYYRMSPDGKRVIFGGRARFNGSGVAMMTYLGYQTARKIAGKANAICAFDLPEFPDHPLYNGRPWFLPIVGSYYRMRDRMDRLVA